jgi:outer membrane protein TolC
MRSVLVLISVTYASWCISSEIQPLPTPLTLEYALSLADNGHPERLSAEAALAQAEAHKQQVEASDDLRLGLSAQLRAIEPSEIARYQSHNDSLARLTVSKQLYDFGRTAHAQDAADAGLASQQWQLVATRQERRLEIMSRFFDVLLADLEVARDNEALSIDYIRFDRARVKHELGKLSDIDLLALESQYQQSRRTLTISQSRQRITRSQLAIGLNHPDDLPADLETPVFEPMKKQYDIDQLVMMAIQGNPQLKSLRSQLRMAEKQLQVSEAQDNPVIRAELEAATYQRELGGRDPLSVALILEWPLYQGNLIDAKKAEQRALIQQKQAQLRAYELALRQQLLDYWMELEQLRIEYEALSVKGDYRDLYLDRSRTLYEMDLATDLGDSMTQIADIQFKQAKNLFQTQLIQARLSALTGGTLESAIKSSNHHQ